MHKCRINIDYGFSFVPYALNLTMGGPPMGNWCNIWLYGSNSATDFNVVSDINVSGNMILLYMHSLILVIGRRVWVISY